MADALSAAIADRESDRANETRSAADATNGGDL
jgi:hypothetical protein